MTTVFAVLVNDPYRLTVDEIRKLTPVQVKRLYLCERDENGAVYIEKPPPLTNRRLTDLNKFYRGIPRYLW